MRATHASDDRLARNVWGRLGSACRMPHASRKRKVRNRRKRSTSMQWGPARAGAGLAHGAGGCKGGRKEVGERGRAPAHRRWRSGRERQRVRGGTERESAPASQKGREGETDMGGQSELNDRESEGERERCYGRSLYA